MVLSKLITIKWPKLLLWLLTHHRHRHRHSVRLVSPTGLVVQLYDANFLVMVVKEGLWEVGLTFIQLRWHNYLSDGKRKGKGRGAKQQEEEVVEAKTEHVMLEDSVIQMDANPLYVKV